MIPMRSLFLALLGLLLPVAVSAQTQGVAGVNDYWITPGATPGGFSCRGVIMPTPVTMTMNLSAGASTNFVILWGTCPCQGCSTTFPLISSPCLPAPTSNCPSSNQFLDVLPFSSCTLITINGTTTPAGTAGIPIFVPAVGTPVTLSTQAVILGPLACLPAAFPVLVSQAWNVKFN